MAVYQYSQFATTKRLPDYLQIPASSTHPRHIFPKTQLAAREAGFLKRGKLQLEGVYGGHTERSGRDAEAEVAGFDHTDGACWWVGNQNNSAVVVVGGVVVLLLRPKT